MDNHKDVDVMKKDKPDKEDHVGYGNTVPRRCMTKGYQGLERQHREYFNTLTGSLNGKIQEDNIHICAVSGCGDMAKYDVEKSYGVDVGTIDALCGFV